MKQLNFSLIETIEHIYPSAYAVVTDLKDDSTYVCPKAASFLNINHGIHSDFFHMLTDYIHPYDRDEYLQGIEERFRFEHLDWELCIRFGNEEKYNMFRFIFHVLKDEEGNPEFFIVVMNDENVGPSFDFMTDLYAKTRFESDMVRFSNEHDKLAVILVNLDYIRDINMLYGQNCGYSLYKNVALHFIYKMDFNKAVYRVNDAGFTFILKNADRTDALLFSKELRECLEREIYFEGTQLPLRSSMSCLLLEDYTGETDTVQSKLEYAVEISREKHRGQLVFFNDLVSASNSNGLDIIRITHRSVQRGCEGFYVEYQPIVNASTGVIEGAESLVRWKMEPFGVVPPGLFIGWMENNSCMFELGNFVLETALTEGLEILKINPSFFINVNISEKQLERPEFHEVVEDLLKKTGFPKKNLCLELTERCKNLPLSQLSDEMSYFKNLGIRIALDDYGTGSSSSSVALNVPVDEIKIDMSFVKGIENNPKQQCLVRSIINFANTAGLMSCIEGVETKELQDYLRGFGATWFQGYYYSKPISLEALKRLLTG